MASQSAYALRINYYYCLSCAELREEDNADKPNEYVETCIGRSEPVAKVGESNPPSPPPHTHTHSCKLSLPIHVHVHALISYVSRLDLQFSFCFLSNSFFCIMSCCFRSLCGNKFVYDCNFYFHVLVLDHTCIVFFNSRY